MKITRRHFLVGTALAGAATYAGWEFSKTSTNAHIVIAGGGAAGISIANKLQHYLSGAKITVIDPRPYHWYQPGQTLLLAGAYRNVDDVKTPNQDYISTPVEWIAESLASFDPDNNRVETDQGTRISYDFLIVATGLELRYDQIAGLDTQQIGQDGIASIYYSPEAGVQSHQQAMAFAESGSGKGVFTRPVGAMKCAGAPMKATNLVEYFARQAGNRDKFQFDYLTSENFLFSVKAFNQRLIEIWKERDINYHYDRYLTALDSSAKTATFSSMDGSQQETREWDFIHVVPPMSAVPAVRNSPLADTNKYPGYLEVDQYSMQHKRYPNVFGLGDTVGTPIGKTAASVKSQLPVVAENITALINDKPLTGRWNGYTSCPMILDVGHAMLWEFDYGMQPMTALPFQVVDPLAISEVAWVMEKSLIRPVYDVMLEGFTPI